jgi:hypothetical protein
MNGAHWHLVLNHLPIIIPMVGLLVMFGGILVKSEVLKRAAFSIFILGAITTIAAFSRVKVPKKWLKEFKVLMNN